MLKLNRNKEIDSLAILAKLDRHWGYFGRFFRLQPTNAWDSERYNQRPWPIGQDLSK